MSINLQNYEAWFLDYVEGTLSPEQVEKLLRFVASHPELKEELEEFELIELPVQPKSFQNKESLKKGKEDVLAWITLINCEERFIEASENLLDSNQTKKLHTFLEQHPEKQESFDVYLQLKIAPDTNILFTDKSGLKRIDVTALTPEELLLIGASEKTLSKKEEKALATLLVQKPNLKSTVSAYADLKLLAPLVIYPDKAALKQKERKGVIIPLWSYTAAAAVILLLIWWRFGSTTTAPSNPNFANSTENSTPAIPVEEKPTPVLPSDQNETSFALQEEQIDVPKHNKPKGPDQFIVLTNNIQNVLDEPKDSVLIHNNTILPKPDTEIALENIDPPKEENPIVPQLDEQDAIASITPPTKEFLSVGEMVSKKVNTVLSGEEQEVGEKITAVEVATNLTSKLDAITSTDIAYANNSTETQSEWSIRIGKFGFSRSKARRP